MAGRLFRRNVLNVVTQRPRLALAVGTAVGLGGFSSATSLKPNFVEHKPDASSSDGPSESERHEAQPKQQVQPRDGEAGELSQHHVYTTIDSTLSVWKAKAERLARSVTCLARIATDYKAAMAEVERRRQEYGQGQPASKVSSDDTAVEESVPGHPAAGTDKTIVQMAEDNSIIYEGTTDHKGDEEDLEELINAPLEACHWQSARRLRDLFQQNGGIYIKIGQYLGLLNFLIPQAYVETMQCLFDKAPQTSFQDVQHVLRDAFGQDLDDLFEEFDPVPLASASLAQVHRAVTKDGRQVAVKVQHPSLLKTVDYDVTVVERLVWAIKQMFPDFRYDWLVEEMREYLPKELDFEQEGKNAERLATHLAADNSRYPLAVRVPRVHWDLTRSNVLCMDFEEGIPLSDVKALSQEKDIDMAQVNDTVTRLFAYQMFLVGFVHCDPHPGNLLVRYNRKQQQSEVVLLDHGLYRVLPRRIRISYCSLWEAILRGDEPAIKKHAQDLNAGSLYRLMAAMLAYKSWDQITASSLNKSKLQLGPTPEEKKRLQGNVKKQLKNIHVLLETLPREILFMLKTNDCLRGIEYNLRAARPSDFAADTRRAILMQGCLMCLVQESGSSAWSWRRLQLGTELEAVSAYIWLSGFWRAFVQGLQRWSLCFKSWMTSGVPVSPAATV